MRRLIPLIPVSRLLLCLPVAMAVLPPPAVAQEAGISMRVTPAFEGWYDAGQWIELQVELVNQGPGQDARLELTAGGDATYAVEVELPPGAHKRVPVLVLPQREQVQAVLKAGRRVLGRQKLQLRAKRHEFLAVVVADQPVRLPGLFGSAGPERVVRLEVAPDRLPESGQGYGSVDLVVVAGADTSDLSAAQRRALYEWVALGGLLVVGGGPTAAASLEGLDALRPAAVTGVREIDGLAGLEDYVWAEVPEGRALIAELAPEPEASVAVSTAEGLPLVVQRRLGQGEMLLLAFDPAAEPVLGWTQAEALWARVRAESAPRRLAPGGEALEWVASGVANLREFELPSLDWTILFLAAYVLLVGPVNYVVLRRRRRLDLAWVTIPALTVAATVGMYATGLWLHGSQLVIYELSAVQVIPGAELARVRTFVGLFSPRSRSYQVTVDTGLVYALSQASSPGGPGLVVEASPPGPTVVRDLAVAQWSLGAFAVEAVIDWPSTPAGQLQAEPGRVRGQLHNPFGRAVEEAAFLHTTATQLGRWPVDEPRKVSSRLAVPDRPLEVYVAAPSEQQTALRAVLLQAVLNSSGPLGVGPPGFGPGPYYYQSRSGGNTVRAPVQEQPLLIGWLDDAPLSVRVNGLVGRRIRQTLVYSPVVVTRYQQALGYATGVRSRAPAADEQGGCAGRGVIFGSSESRVWMEFELQPGEQPDRLWVALVSDEPGLEVQVSFWPSGEPEPVELGSVSVDRVLEIPDARQLLSSTGRVRLRLERNSAGAGYPLAGLYCGQVRLYLRPPARRELRPVPWF